MLLALIAALLQNSQVSAQLPGPPRELVSLAFSTGHCAVPFSAEVENMTLRGPRLVDFDLDLGTIMFTNPGWSVDLKDTAGRRAVAGLRSAEVFDVSRHPRMSFRATGANSLGGNWYHLYGELSLRGQSSEVVLEVFREPVAEEGRFVTQTITGHIDPRPFGIEYNPQSNASGIAGDLNGKLLIRFVTTTQVDGC